MRQRHLNIDKEASKLNPAEVSGLLTRVMSRVPSVSQEVQGHSHREASVGPIQRSRSELEWSVPGIFSQTRVTTSFGKVPAHLLRIGDSVRTGCANFLPVLGIREFNLDFEFIDRHPSAAPVLIPSASLGRDRPSQDIVLSPAQLVSPGRAAAASGMIPAHRIRQSRRTVDRTLGRVSYYEFLFQETVDIACEGLWVRSAEV